jgi:exopolysaccharide biosynthesis polyprenyl glycosylphosphotransferase
VKSNRLVESIIGVQTTVANKEATGTPGSLGSSAPAAPASPLSPTSTGTTSQLTKVISERRSLRRQWQVFETIAMILLDIALAGASFLLAYYLRYKVFFNSQVIATLRNNLLGIESNATHSLPKQDVSTPLSAFTTLVIGYMVGLIVIFAVRGLYRIRPTGSWFRQAKTIVTSTTLGLTILIAYYFVFQSSANSRLLVPFIWATTIMMLCVFRLIFSWIMGWLYRLGVAETRVLVVGSGRLSKLIMQHMAANPHLGYAVVGFLHDLHDVNEAPGDFGRFKMLGTLEDLGMVIRSMQIDEVIIALPSHLHQQSIRSVRLLERLGTSFKLVPDLYEFSLSRIDMEAVDGIPLIGIKQVSLNTMQRLVTRVIDATISTLVLLIGLPLWLFIALAIKLTSKGPIIYKQTRIGQNGRSFIAYKFRTMYKDAEAILPSLMAYNEAQGPLFKIKGDPRITLVGKFMRRTSFDEIPQFLNILKGDMSLVGPRPALPREVDAYEDWQKERLAMKPGLTGLWQVRGRSDISFDEGVLMDLYYIQNWSLRLYFQILFRTIPAVVFSRGAY